MPWITSRDQQKTWERTVFSRIKKKKTRRRGETSSVPFSPSVLLFLWLPFSFIPTQSLLTFCTTRRLFFIVLHVFLSTLKWVLKSDFESGKGIRTHWRTIFVVEKREWELNHEEGKETIGLECHVCFMKTVDSLLQGWWWEEDSFCRALFWLKKRRKRWSRDRERGKREKRKKQKENDLRWLFLSVFLTVCLSVLSHIHFLSLLLRGRRRRSPAKLETSVEFRKREKLL